MKLFIFSHNSWSFEKLDALLDGLLITIASIIIHVAIKLPLTFTNAIFVDAERDGDQWLKEWKEEQSRINVKLF